MKDLGSITKDFPFLDDETRNEIRTVMGEAEGYWNFGELIYKKSLKQTTSPLLVFFALYHLSRLENNGAAEKLVDAHPSLPLPMPFVYPDGELLENSLSIMEKAIDFFRNPVTTFYILMRWYRLTSDGSPEERNVQNMIENLLTEHKQLRLPGADYHGHTAFRLKKLGFVKEAYSKFNHAVNLTKESDDQWHEAILLTILSELVGQYVRGPNHLEKARSYLARAMQISKSLGAAAAEAKILQTMSVYSIIRNELNEAVDCQLKATEIEGELGRVNTNAAYNFAVWYAEMGEGQTALEWGKIAVEQRQGPYTYMGLAWAYIALGDYVRAEKTLDVAKELTLKNGLETTMGQWYHANGKLEHRRGDLESAMDYYQQALAIHQKATRLVRVRSSMRELAKVELDMFNPTKENRDDEFSGPYMKQLEEEIEGEDLPGYIAELLYMKAELRMKQGRHDEAEKLLESVIELTDCSSLRWIYQKATKIREIWVEDGLLVPRRAQKSRKM